MHGLTGRKDLQPMKEAYTHEEIEGLIDGFYSWETKGLYDVVDVTGESIVEMVIRGCQCCGDEEEPKAEFVGESFAAFIAAAPTIIRQLLNELKDSR